MNVSLMPAVRFLAWGIAVTAVVGMFVSYDSLPETLPLTRWTAAPKTPLLALRVSLINLLTLGLIELLWCGLRRVKGFAHPDSVAATLLLTLAAKAGVEGAGLLLLPVPFAWTLWPLIVIIVAGLGTAAYFGRELFDAARWNQLRMTRLESIAALAIISAIVILNVPIVVR